MAGLAESAALIADFFCAIRGRKTAERFDTPVRFTCR